MSRSGAASLDRFLAGLVASGALSAASARVVEGDRITLAGAAGWRDVGRRSPADMDSVYDLASLTKVVTATLALVLDRRGLLPLRTPIGDLEPKAAALLARRTLEDCLRHRAGLAPWVPLYALGRSAETALEPVLTGAFPALGEAAYSDLGYVLWTWLAERALGDRLPALLDLHVLGPLEMRSAGTSPLPVPAADVAVCHLDGGREVELAAHLGIRVDAVAGPFHGVPQDGNARFLGGFAGHAGLFGTLEDIHRLAAEWLRPTRILEAEQTRWALGGETPYALGWWRPAAVPALAEALPPGSYGMLGFTGGTLWIDPGRGRVAALLGHRVDSSRPATDWRREFLGLAMA